jgi:type IV pilus assembly protein PilB
MESEHKRLGEFLVDAGAITQEQLENALRVHRRTGQLLGLTLIQMGYVNEQILLQHLHRQLGLPLLDLERVVVDEQALALVKEEVARKHLALPLEVIGRSTLVVALADPLNMAALEDLRFHSGMFIKPALASPSAINDAITRYYHMEDSVNQVIQKIIDTEEDVVVSTVTEQEQVANADELLREAEGKPIVRLTNWLLMRAVEERASDIHIEPQDRDVVVRLRVDGLLMEVQRLPKWTQGALISRVKVLSNLDIAEKRKPQDGRLMVQVAGRRLEMRVSTLSTTHGEKVVIRVIDQERAPLKLDTFGFQPDDLARVREFLQRPQGILVVSGPTGSGKSTVLYAILRELHDVSRNIVTVEDPVEFQIPGINQVQVDEKAKKTFPSSLRAILRQDPDIIMIGEIRDKETAQIAFRASITGHLVVTTVHTNDTASAVTRLLDLGLEPYMVASSIIGIVSMRLVRTICPRCKETYAGGSSQLNRLGPQPDDRPVTLYRGAGCVQCHHTGFLGRTGIFEVLDVNEAIRSQITRGSHDTMIRHASRECGMRSLGEDGILKVLAGQTTLEEVTRVVYLAEHSAKVCPSCSTVLAPEYEFCPTCRTYVGEKCARCRRKLNRAWGFCPYCGEVNGSSESSEQLAGTAEILPVPIVIEGGSEGGLRKAS